MGGDEVSARGLGQSAEEQAYMKQHGLSGKDLYWHHVVRIYQIIRKHGKRTMLWGGFNLDGNAKAKIPDDVISMVWRSRQRPTGEDHASDHQRRLETALRGGQQGLAATVPAGEVERTPLAVPHEQQCGRPTARQPTGPRRRCVPGSKRPTPKFPAFDGVCRPWPREFTTPSRAAPTPITCGDLSAQRRPPGYPFLPGADRFRRSGGRR